MRSFSNKILKSTLKSLNNTPKYFYIGPSAGGSMFATVLKYSVSIIGGGIFGYSVSGSKTEEKKKTPI